MGSFTLRVGGRLAALTSLIRFALSINSSSFTNFRRSLSTRLTWKGRKESSEFHWVKEHWYIHLLTSLRHMEFLGQGSDLSCSCNLYAAVAVPDPLTHCSRPGIEPVSWYCRDATNLLVPQWELLDCWVFVFFFVFLIQLTFSHLFLFC